MSQSLSQSLSLLDRRTLLREVESGKNQQDVTTLERAFAGASEEDRAALAKTLPPTRLFKAEGATPRAAYVLAALGKPKLVADTLGESKSDVNEYVKLAARGRENDWTLALCEQLTDTPSMDHRLLMALAVLLQADQGLIARSPSFVGHMPYFIAYAADRDMSPQAGAKLIVQRLKENDGLLMHAFWQFFELEGLGANWNLTNYDADAWDAALLLLCQADPEFRARLLDESLGALLRDFPAKSVLWYPRVQRLLQPNVQEIIRRQQTYVSVLLTTPSTAVGLAQDMLSMVVQDPALDVDALLDASPAVLARTEKKLVKAQLQLLAKLNASTEQGRRIAQIIGEVLEALPLDLADLARKLFAPSTQKGRDERGASKACASANTSSQTTASVVEVPPPPLQAKGSARAEALPIVSEMEFNTLIAAHFEGVGDGADYPRMFAYLAQHPGTALSPELQQRGENVIESIWDANVAAPRRLLAAVLLGRDQVRFKGYAKFLVITPGEPAPAGAELKDNTLVSSEYDAESGEYRVVETWTSRSGHLYMQTHAPLALLASAFAQLGAARKQGTTFDLASPVPARKADWKRVLLEPGEGCFGRDLDVLGEERRAFWLVDGADPASLQRDGLHALALDVSHVANEFTFRAQEAREQDGYEQIVQWTAWLLRDNPDTLAAHCHPMLCAAVKVVNVRGVGALMHALGSARQPLAGPAYSALALAASAKMPEQRAQSAEAIAQLADAGMLHPAAFAEQIAAHLADDFVIAGRVAQTLADAASISALAGYRVLQTLDALLPHVLDDEGKPRTQASKLVELAARLSTEYGTPLVIPEPLIARGKGASALAVAIRTLTSVQPQATDLVTEAAAKSSQQQ